ncbi:O-methyltransferase [Persephonella sp.]
MNVDILKYLTELYELKDPVLNKMEKFGHENEFPIIDKYAGKFLFIITKILKPKLIVEIGSGFGYSGYFFCKGLTDGKIVLIDYQEKNINKAKEFFREGGLLEKAEFKVGDAVDIGENYKNIDILFLDLEKVRYLEAVKKLEKNLSKNGVIIADNVLWHGKILDKSDKKAEKLREFNKYMAEKYDSIIIPVGDGLLLAVKR